MDAPLDVPGSSPFKRLLRSTCGTIKRSAPREPLGGISVRMDGALTKNEFADIRRKRLSWSVMTLIFTNVGLLALAVAAWYSFGGISQTLAYLRGDPLITDAYARSVGTIERGSNQEIVFKISNHSTRPVKILGAKTSCSCVHLDSLPLTVLGEGSLPFRIRFYAGVRQGKVVENVRLFVDHPSQRRLDLTIKGYIP